MGDAAQQKLQQLQNDSLTTIANVSRLLRQAIGAALPVAPEQYLTIAIPGTVIDLTDVEKGGTFVWDVTNSAFPPVSVRQAEATLVDGMMPLSNVMLGNTGKSVARSYSRALDGLIPRKATFKLGDQIRSPGEAGYDKAMSFLTSIDPATGKTPIDIYIEKQEAWGMAQSEWNSARINAQTTAQRLYPQNSSADYIMKQTQYFNEWNQKNYQRYKTNVQGRYMDWVTNGQKYNVEYSFGMVDIDSIMQRIEASKESMRNSALVDADGANEVYGVSLTPKTWATYCQRKAAGWYDKYGGYTLGQIDAEIDRLTTLKKAYGTLSTITAATGRSYPATSAAHAPSVTLQAQATTVSNAAKKVYAARAAMTDANFPATAQTPEAAAAAATTHRNTLTDAQKDLAKEEKTLQDLTVQWNEYNVATLNGSAGTSVSTWITDSTSTIDKQLQTLNTLRTEKSRSNPITLPVIIGATNDADNGTGEILAAPGAEFAQPIFGIDEAGAQKAATAHSADQADPWTNITFSYSATDQKTDHSTSSWGMSVGASVGFGLWSVGGNYSHDESKEDMQSDMASCDVSISFSAMVVNINRPWLYGEIFSDFDIDVAENVTLSPGAAQLQQLIKDQDPVAMNMYGEFPAYPTSFIVAADTVIEFTGKTSHIEEHFSSHSNSGGISVGYGPWSVSSSFHEAASEQHTQMHATANGCKIMFGAPQVIGFVSQILPALPRPQNYNPLTQGAGVPLLAVGSTAAAAVAGAGSGSGGSGSGGSGSAGSGAAGSGSAGSGSGSGGSGSAGNAAH